MLNKIAVIFPAKGYYEIAKGVMQSEDNILENQLGLVENDEILLADEHSFDDEEELAQSGLQHSSQLFVNMAEKENIDLELIDPGVDIELSYIFNETNEVLIFSVALCQLKEQEALEV